MIRYDIIMLYHLVIVLAELYFKEAEFRIHPVQLFLYRKAVLCVGQVLHTNRFVNVHCKLS